MDNRTLNFGFSVVSGAHLCGQDAMTSKKVLLSRPRRLMLIALVVLWVGLWFGLAGCNRRIALPKNYASPYPATKLWAVVPFANESGTTVPDPMRVADQLTQQLQQVEGVDVLPVNRVIEAMAAQQFDEVTTLTEAHALMDMLQVDGLLVGSITAWDPYEPPKIGISVQLYSRRRGKDRVLDSRQLTAATSGNQLPTVHQEPRPIAQVSDYFDAANGDILRRLQQYAYGRTPTDAPAGWRRYLLDMDLYSEFVSHELMRRLFRSEWQRMHVVQAPAGDEMTSQSTP